MPKCPKCEKEVYFGTLSFSTSKFQWNFSWKSNQLGEGLASSLLEMWKVQQGRRSWKIRSIVKILRSWARVRMLRIAENHIATDHVTQLCLVLKDLDAVEMSHIHSIRISPWKILYVLGEKSRNYYFYLTFMVTFEFNFFKIKFHDSLNEFWLVGKSLSL